MSARWFERWCMGVALCAVAAVGLAGWLRTVDPPPPDREPIPAVVAANVRAYFENQDFVVRQLAVTRVVGDTAYFTMRLEDYLPAAGRFKAKVAYGWHVVRIEPVRDSFAGP